MWADMPGRIPQSSHDGYATIDTMAHPPPSPSRKHPFTASLRSVVVAFAMVSVGGLLFTSGSGVWSPWIYMNTGKRPTDGTGAFSPLSFKALCNSPCWGSAGSASDNCCCRCCDVLCGPRVQGKEAPGRAEVTLLLCAPSRSDGAHRRGVPGT